MSLGQDDLFQPAAAATSDRMPAISLWQPWGSACLRPELKVHETRHWLPPRHLIGRRVAIHAAARAAPEGLDIQVERAMADTFGRDWRLTLPRGCIVGTVVLQAARSMRDVTPAHALDEAFGDWSPARFAWRLSDPIPLALPLPCKGRQGWFAVDLPKEDR